jgi:hypothetical protein
LEDGSTDDAWAFTELGDDFASAETAGFEFVGAASLTAATTSALVAFLLF